MNELKCKRCGYKWITKSKLLLVSCPSCGYKVKNKEKISSKISLIFLSIFLISLISAINLNSGDTYTFNLENYAYYTITGNSSIVDLNVSQNGSLVTISLGKYTPSDSFEITFYNEKGEVVSCGSYSCSGGTRRIYIDKNITKYVDIPCNNCGTVNETNEIPIIIPPKSSFSWLWLGLVLLLVGLIITLIVLIKRRKILKGGTKNGKMQKRKKEK